MAVFLVDSSIWIGAQRHPYLLELLSERLGRGSVATCVPVALEVLAGARSAERYERDWESLWKQLDWVPLDGDAAQRALRVQREPAKKSEGAHRRGASDYLIAACAELAGEEVTLWHWDRDLTAICELTGQPHEPEHARARRRGARLPGTG